MSMHAFSFSFSIGRKDEEEAEECVSSLQRVSFERKFLTKLFSVSVFSLATVGMGKNSTEPL